MLSLTQKNKLLDLCIGLFGVVLGFEILFSQDYIVEHINNFVLSIGAYGWVAIALLQYLQVVFVPIPAYFVTILSMRMYSDQLILLYIMTLCALLLGVATTYLLGYKFGNKAIRWVAGSEEDCDKWMSIFKTKKANLFYFASVLLPIFPDDLLCVMAGSMRMDFWWFMFSNIIGRAIGLASFMFVFKESSGSVFNIILMSVLFVLSIILKIVVKVKLKKESENELIDSGE